MSALVTFLPVISSSATVPVRISPSCAEDSFTAGVSVVVTVSVSPSAAVLTAVMTVPSSVRSPDPEAPVRSCSTVVVTVEVPRLMAADHSPFTEKAPSASPRR